MDHPVRVPLHVQILGDELLIVLDKPFEQWSDRWSPMIIARYAGPFASVRIDCSRCKRLTSAFFAGAIHLRQVYGPKAAVVLDQLDVSLLRGLAAMRIEGLFTVVMRAPAGA